MHFLLPSSPCNPEGRIGDSISNYYRPQNGSPISGGAASSLSLDTDSVSQRTQAPTVSIGGSASSASLSSALWLSQVGKLESKTGATTEAPGTSSAAGEFMEWANMSLAEKVRAQVLAAKNLTEEDLAAMEPDKRAAIEAEIKEAIMRQMGVETGPGETGAAAATSISV